MFAIVIDDALFFKADGKTKGILRPAD